MQYKLLNFIIALFASVTFILFTNCSSYFSKSEFLKNPPELIAQNSRMALLVSDDGKLKVVARLMHLNEVDGGVYKNREYFFLEIFNDDEDVVLPDSMRITMFDKPPLWIRGVEGRELDDVLFLDNSLSYGFLIAFNRPSVFKLKNMEIKLVVDNFQPAIFNFSYTILNSKL